jgi:hypothetical protein
MRNILILITLFLSIVVHAEQGNKNINFEKCGTQSPSKEWENLFQNQIQKFKQNNQNARTNNNIVIPVIVHVVYYTNNSSQNITKARIDSQIAILNRDFAGMSEFAYKTPSPFRPLVANTGITFCPAKLKPDGTKLTNPGIDLINGKIKGYSDPFTDLGGVSGWGVTGELEDVIKPQTIWDPTFYYNIWVVPNISITSRGSVLGYATFPTMSGLDGIDGTGTMSNDGIVILSSVFGKGGSAVGYGGTATHETGHWLGLRHIWGDEECGDDFCDDTPVHKEDNAGCPTFPKLNTCTNVGSNGEMFMNYMDYVDDECYTMFSNGQKERMLTTMQNGNLRVPLLTSPVCDTVKPAPVAKFNATQTSLNTSNCAVSATFNFYDKSMFAPTTWSWTFEGGTPATSNLKNPTGIVFTSSGLKNVTFTSTSAKGTSTITKQINVVMTNSGNFPLIENFEGPNFPPVGWAFVKRSANPLHNWERREDYSAFGSGNASMIYNNTEFEADYKFDDIFSPKLDLSGITQAKLKFDVAYAPYYDSNETIADTLEVFITDNCGTTSTKIYAKGAAELATFLPGIATEFYPTANQWRSDTINVPAIYLNKPNVQIFFRNRGSYGHTIYVDNANLFLPAQNPIPNFTMSKDAICVGDSVTFTNTTLNTIDSLRWKINIGSPNTSNSQTIVKSKFNQVGTHTITLFVFKGTFVDSISKTITVSNKPNVTINPSSTLVCPNTSVSLTANGATSYVWNNGSTTNPINSTILNNTTFKVVGTTNGCASDSVAVTVNTKTKPTVIVTPLTQAICLGESATFNASGASTYAWNNGQSSSILNVSPSSNTSYKVAGTTDGCTSDSVQVTVTLKTKPTITVTPQNTTICTGQSVTIIANGASSYGWNSGQTNSSITVSPVQTTTYKVSGTSNGCNSDSVSAIVNIDTVLVVSISRSPNVNVICEGDSITLTASGANIYTWTTGQNIASIKVAPSVQSSYGVVGLLTGCPTLRDSVGTTINVNPRPSMGMITRGGWDTIFVNPATGTSYLWYFNTNTSPIATTSVPYYFATQNGNYAVQIVDANNCKSIKTNPPYSVTLTGIRNNASEIGLKIFPNPNHGIFTIELNSQKYTEYNMNVYNVAGRQIYIENFVVNKGYNTKTISIPNIEKGIYFLNLINEDGIATYQLLIQ